MERRDDGSLAAAGDPRLRPGARVKVSGVGEPFAGQYVLTAATHLVDSRVGYVTELSTAPPPPRRPRARQAVVTKGVVTRVNDPDGLGRLRVSLPTFGSVEAEWMGAVAPGAGRGKGLIISPDVGDQVLVLFVQDDPAQGLVLGGLYGAGGPPDAGIDGDSVTRYTLVSGKGQKVEGSLMATALGMQGGQILTMDADADSALAKARGRIREARAGGASWVEIREMLAESRVVVPRTYYRCYYTKDDEIITVACLSAELRRKFGRYVVRSYQDDELQEALILAQGRIVDREHEPARGLGEQPVVVGVGGRSVDRAAHATGDRHLGQHEGDGLLLFDRDAEGFAVLGVIARVFVRGACHANDQSTERDAPAIEQRRQTAFQSGAARDSTTLECHLVGCHTAQTHVLLAFGDRHAGAAARHDEGGHATVAGIGRGLGEDDEELGQIGVGDPDLAAGEAIAAVDALGAGTDAGHVGPGVRLGHRETRQRAVGRRPQVPVTLHFAAGDHDRLGRQRVHTQRRADPEAAAAQGFGDQDQFQATEAAATQRFSPSVFMSFVISPLRNIVASEPLTRMRPREERSISPAPPSRTAPYPDIICFICVICVPLLERSCNPATVPLLVDVMPAPAGSDDKSARARDRSTNEASLPTPSNSTHDIECASALRAQPTRALRSRAGRSIRSCDVGTSNSLPAPFASAGGSRLTRCVDYKARRW